MASVRKFAMIQPKTLQRKEYRQLPSPEHKLAYLSLLICPNATYIAYFFLSIEQWSLDSGIAKDVLGRIVDDLQEAGLIRYNREESIVRIVGWFDAVNRPHNLSFMKGLLADIWDDTLPQTDFLLDSCVELLIACCISAANWKKEKSEVTTQVLN